jgi:hypothetical protein
MRNLGWRLTGYSRHPMGLKMTLFARWVKTSVMPPHTGRYVALGDTLEWENVLACRCQVPKSF